MSNPQLTVEKVTVPSHSSDDRTLALPVSNDKIKLVTLHQRKSTQANGRHRFVLGLTFDGEGVAPIEHFRWEEN